MLLKNKNEAMCEACAEEEKTDASLTVETVAVTVV